MATSVQQVLDAATTSDKVPGIVFGMMDKNGKWLAKAASGVASLDKPDEKMAVDSVFAIYSCTKVGLDRTRCRLRGPANIMDP